MLLSAVRAFDGTSRVCRYKAPELLVDRPRYTEKVDCWSLGVIFFVMLSGGLPFYDDETGDMDSKVIKGEYYFDAEEWDHVSDSAKDFIRQILVVDPKQRPSCEEMLQHKYGKPASLRVLAGAPRPLTVSTLPVPAGGSRRPRSPTSHCRSCRRRSGPSTPAACFVVQSTACVLACGCTTWVGPSMCVLLATAQLRQLGQGQRQAPAARMMATKSARHRQPTEHGVEARSIPEAAEMAGVAVVVHTKCMSLEIKKVKFMVCHADLAGASETAKPPCVVRPA